MPEIFVRDTESEIVNRQASKKNPLIIKGGFLI